MADAAAVGAKKCLDEALNISYLGEGLEFCSSSCLNLSNGDIFSLLGGADRHHTMKHELLIEECVL